MVVPDIVTASEFLNVTIKMLGAHVMERAFMAALEHAPEALDTVGVGHASDVLPDAMCDAFVVAGKALISTRFVGINSRAILYATHDETLKRLGVRILDHGGAHLVGRPVLGTDDGSLAN